MEMHVGHARKTIGYRVGAGEDGDHAGRSACGVSADRADTGVGMRRPHEPCVRLTRNRKIVGEATLTPEQAIVFETA